MKQIKLTEFTESYAEIAEEHPSEDMEVFFRTKDGQTFKGQFFAEKRYDHVDHFDNLQGETFDIWDVYSWHPVTVDL